jgi:hypothetical protein
MFEAFMFLQVLAWPAVAGTALLLGARAWDDYSRRRKLENSELRSEFLELERKCKAMVESVNRTAERVGQLEISQGVKRRG